MERTLVPLEKETLDRLLEDKQICAYDPVNHPQFEQRVRGIDMYCAYYEKEGL